MKLINSVNETRYNPRKLLSSEKRKRIIEFIRNFIDVDLILSDLNLETVEQLDELPDDLIIETRDYWLIHDQETGNEEYLRDLQYFYDENINEYIEMETI